MRLSQAIRRAPGPALLGLALLGAALLLSSCPRAGILSYGVEVSEEGGSSIFSLVKAPTFSVSNAATLYAPTTLMVSSETPETEILYTTTPGAEPSLPFPQSGLLLDGNVTIRAQAVRNEIAKSSIVERQYSFKVPAPVFDPLVQPNVAADITITAIAGAEIRLSDQNAAQMATVSGNPFTFVGLPANKNLYVQAIKTNWEASEMITY